MPSSRFSQRRPYLFVLFMQIILLVSYLAAGAITFKLHLPAIGLYGLANLALTVVAVALLSSMGWWRVTGFRAAQRPRDLLLFGVAFVPALINLSFGFKTLTLNTVLVYLVVALLVGFAEEAFFRGLMLQALLPRGAWKAVLLTTLLFGFTHLMNVLAGADILYTLLQIGWALAIGFGFAVLALCTGLVWPLVLAHAAIDFTSFISTAGVGISRVLEYGLILAIIVLFVGVGFYLMHDISAKPA